MVGTNSSTEEAKTGFRVWLYTSSQPYAETGSEEVYLEDICKSVAKSVGISTVTLPLFGLVDYTHKTWLGLHEKIIPAEWTEGDVYFRMRFSPAQKVLQRLAKKEPKFIEYLYNQCRDDFLKGRLASIYEQRIDKEKSFGLGVLERLIYCRSNNLIVGKIQCFNDSIPPTMRQEVTSQLNPLKRLRFNRNCKRELEKLDKQVQMCKVEILWMRFISGIYQYVDNYLIENYDVRQQYHEGHVEDKRIYVKPNEEIVSVGKLKDIHSMEIRRNCEEQTEFGWLVFVWGQEGVPKRLLFKEEAKAKSFVALLIGYYRLTVNYYFCPVERMEPPSLKRLDRLCHGPVHHKYCKSRLSLRGEGTYIVKQSRVLDQLELIYKQRDGEIVSLTIECFPSGHFQFAGEEKTAERLYLLIKSDSRTKDLVDAIPRKQDDNSGLLLCRDDDTNVDVTNPSERLPRAVVPFLNEDEVTFTSEILGTSGYYTEVFDGSMAKGDTRISVAVKRLKNHDKDKCLEPFLAMVHRMREMRSPHIVQLLGVCLLPPVYIALEYSPIGDLERYLKGYRNIVSPAQRLQAMFSVINALQYLIPVAEKHRFLAHGNIRCRNVLVFHHSSVMEVKLGDPGMAHLFNQLPVEHPCNQERLAWLAPELRSNLRAMTPESEIYAFGTMVWEIWANGDHPPDKCGEEIPASLAPDKDDKPYASNLKQTVVDLIKSCHHEDPSRRKQLLELVRTIFTLEYGSNAGRTYSYPFEEEDLPSVSALGTQHTQAPADQQLSREPSVPCPPQAQPVLNERNPGFDVLKKEPPSLDGFVFDDGQTGREQRADNSSKPETMQRDAAPQLTSRRPPAFIGAGQLPSRPLPETSGNDIQQMISRERIKKGGVLGSGHFGIVYQGEMKKDDGEWVPCALKTLKQCDDSPQDDQGLEEEVNVMCKLKHENIVKLYGFCLGNEKESYCLVMEYVKMGSLYEMLRKSRNVSSQAHRDLTPQVVFNICHGVALGMRYLASKNMIHRDLAARNVLLTENYHAKITDFGLAHVLDEKEYYRMNKKHSLPVYYFAPESLMRKTFTEKGDVWSYGILLWEIFTKGNKPELIHLNEVEAEDKWMVLHNELEKGRRLHRPESCPDVAWNLVTENCWTFEPKDRWTFEKIAGFLHAHWNWRLTIDEV